MGTAMCEISIIIPVYNKDKYLTNILDDIHKQSFRDFECILIDDGSCDSSGKICDFYAEKDTRFRVLHIPNGGVSHARNVGLSVAAGRYITFIDADDHVKADYLEQLYDDITSGGADLVIVGPVKFWQNGRPNEVTKMPYSGLTKLRKVMSEFAQVEKRQASTAFAAERCFPENWLREFGFPSGLGWLRILSFICGSTQRLKQFILTTNANTIICRKRKIRPRLFRTTKLITLRSSN